MILGTLCYLKKDSCTLMIHRNKRAGDIHAGKWNGLGGKFEAGRFFSARFVYEGDEMKSHEVVFY